MSKYTRVATITPEDAATGNGPNASSVPHPEYRTSGAHLSAGLRRGLHSGSAGTSAELAAASAGASSSAANAGHTLLSVGAETSIEASGPHHREIFHAKGGSGDIDTSGISSDFDKPYEEELDVEQDGQSLSPDTSSPDAAQSEQKQKSDMVYNAIYAGLWFSFSTGLSIYNKQLLGKDRYAFNFPLLIVSLHAFGHYVMSSALMCAVPTLRPKTQPNLTHFVTRIVPAAACTALDISMSNASLHYISLSFYTMIKSSTPVWVLLFAFMFGLEKPKLELVLIILVICSGVLFTVAGEIRFSLWGFLLILGASIMAGLRWSLTQILLQQASIGINNPVATLRALSPVGAVLIGALALVIELDDIIASPFFGTVGGVMQSLGIIFAGSFLAFCMTLAEFFLIRSTSVVTLSVIGISKEIFVIAMSIIVFGDVVTSMMVVGILITFSGIAAFHRLRTHAHGHGRKSVSRNHSRNSSEIPEQKRLSQYGRSGRSSDIETVSLAAGGGTDANADHRN